MKFIKKAGRCFLSFTLAAALAGGLALVAVQRFTPDRFQVVEGCAFDFHAGFLSARCGGGEIAVNAPASEEKSYEAQLMLFDRIPVKTVQVDVVDDTSVLLCGTPFGIKMFTNGVMVVGMADIQTENRAVNPAIEAGLKVGDIIMDINGVAVNQNEEIATEVAKAGGSPVRITFKRENTMCTTTLYPVRSRLDNAYKAGLWVRDSTAGIGTLTFYDPISHSFAGLGHGICDTDTNELMPLRNGEIVPVSINGVVKGRRGAPGELRGYFSTNIPMGTMTQNVQEGVYGVFESLSQTQQFVQKPVHVAMKQEIQPGDALILTTTDGGKPAYYRVVIEKLNLRGDGGGKDMVLRVTDEALLAKTGGIVQGMSGSPIIQNGKLAGAVTHVFVNDPTRGYGIYAENMLNQSKGVNAAAREKAS